MVDGEPSWDISSISLRLLAVFSAPPLTLLDSGWCDRFAIKDWVGMLGVLHERKRGHAVPPWSAPRVAWLAAVFPCEPVESCARVRRELLRMCQLVRRNQTSCLAHCVSASCLVDNRNTAVGTLRCRRLQIL